MLRLVGTVVGVLFVLPAQVCSMHRCKGAGGVITGTQVSPVMYLICFSSRGDT